MEKKVSRKDGKRCPERTRRGDQKGLEKLPRKDGKVSRKDMKRCQERI